MIHGGCACAGIRYRVTSDTSLDECGYCHCRICQRTSGAPAMVFVTVPMSSFAIQGTPRRWRSTSFGERWSCEMCGSQIGMRVDHEPDTIDLTASSLDDPALAPPRFHIWVESRVRWLVLDDRLPQYPHARS